MRIIISITFLLALAECRRHLCDDGTRPICPDGTRAVYNRPTGKNSKKSNYFPAPVCSGKGPAICIDGSTPKIRFNVCSDDEKKCPKGQGQGPNDKPFDYCADGSHCKCPGDGNSCNFYKRRCANNQKCHKRCKSGVPHCPWFTKNRNPLNDPSKYNSGRNKVHHNWGPGIAGNDPDIFDFDKFCFKQWVSHGSMDCSFLSKNKDLKKICCSTPLMIFCQKECGSKGNPRNYCMDNLNSGNCSFLYAELPWSRECCSVPDVRNELCKCDCCRTDDVCLKYRGACDSPDNNPPCTNPTWTPVCPWQRDQRPTPSPTTVIP